MIGGGVDSSSEVDAHACGGAATGFGPTAVAAIRRLG